LWHFLTLFVIKKFELLYLILFVKFQSQDRSTLLLQMESMNFKGLFWLMLILFMYLYNWTQWNKKIVNIHYMEDIAETRAMWMIREWDYLMKSIFVIFDPTLYSVLFWASAWRYGSQKRIILHSYKVSLYNKIHY